MEIAIDAYANIDAASLQRDGIGSFHIQLGEAGLLQRFGEESIFPIVENMGTDLLLFAPFFYRETALTLLFNEMFPFKSLIFRFGFWHEYTPGFKQHPECHR